MMVSISNYATAKAAVKEAVMLRTSSFPFRPIRAVQAAVKEAVMLNTLKVLKEEKGVQAAVKEAVMLNTNS